MENTSGKRGSLVNWSVVLFLILASCSVVDIALASTAYTAGEFSSMPINIVEEGATPRVLLASGKDHQLFYKAYNDYSDLNGDGKIDTTYNNNIDYYGYFDSYKCYAYNSSGSNPRFEPRSFTTTKYCDNAGKTAANGLWSGNFLNWVSMSRIDSIRKILFGGHRRVDTLTDTTLERSYLPHDAHSWAKYYDGRDLPQLTPFKEGTDYYCDKDTAITSANCTTDGVTDWKKVGVTFGNTTDVNDTPGYYGNNQYSQHYTEPPLIKVVKGNYSLWASNERWQCTWASGAPFDNHSASNSNNPAKSLINAYSNSPAKSQGLGEGQYVARVQACVAGLIDDVGVAAVGGTKEKCKLYPSNNYKPIGLLQTYGDENKMFFGMIASTYGKHADGGDLIRDVKSMADEVNVTTDGTFPLVAVSAGGPKADNSSSGLINAWSLYRIVNYDGLDAKGYYNDADNCPWGQSSFDYVTSDNRCHNWGNPVAEIFLQSINYLADGPPIGPYRSNDSTYISGLNTPQNFTDPLSDTSYCARLSVIVLNSSVISYDADKLDTPSYGPKTIWDEIVLPGDRTSTAMTNYVGAGEGIYGQDYFVGETHMGINPLEDQNCTPKALNANPGLGRVGGLCPEAPRLSGSYRIAGLAYYAHVKDIRPSAHNSSKLPGDQVVDTYAVALATGAPVIEIPDPSGTSTQPLVTILPACRNTTLNPKANCALVDFKVISQEIVNNTATGKVYINWEDSEQGGDYDQDMWGTLTYSLTGNTLSVTTQVHAQSTGDAMAFGYIIGGTTIDGFHAHSGINQFKNNETNVTPENFSCNTPATTGCKCTATNGAHDVCDSNYSGASTKVYTLGTSSAKLLKDPLWYAAKWGGFTDSDGSLTPNLPDEWDGKINATGATGHDLIPDNYFYATNPRQLEDSLDRVLRAILERTSSGTAAAVVSNNVRGEGALYQAYYEPLKKDATTEARWLGTVQALWLDSYGLTRQDCSSPADGGFSSVTGRCSVSPANLLNNTCTPNHKLDNYCVDQVVETFYDSLEKRTRTKIFESDVPNTYTAYSMQGVVDSFNSGTVTMVPNSMEGKLTVAVGAPESLILDPYTMEGDLVAYDPFTGEVEMKVTHWDGPAAAHYSAWQMSTSSSPGTTAYITETITPVVGNGYTFTVVPAGDWIQMPLLPSDPPTKLTFKTKNIVGASGQTFSGWTVQCLNNLAIKGDVSSANLQLNNTATDTFSIDPVTPNFVGCTEARLSTYNLKGTAGTSYSQWKVTNLDSLSGKGTSATSIILGNDDPRTFSVTPSVAWLSEGDSVFVSNKTFATKELYEIGYLWNAREQLYLPGINNAALETNRNWNVTSNASQGRFIKTWVDANLNGVVDAGEYRDFDKGMFDNVSYTFFDVNDTPTAKNIVDFVRGIEVPGSRNRTILYSKDDTVKHVMRLGDIVNSTPAVVGAPQEGFDLLYNDASYKTFRQKYIDRRIMIYAGGNDGLIHAFNGGFYTKVVEGKNTKDEKSYIEYSVQSGTASEHPLGSEIWAYAPYNLLSHLQWLTDPEYGKKTHVYYMDGKPRIFDAKIFTPDPALHLNGWGTVMVMGMNLGGGHMDISVDEDNNATTAKKAAFKRSAYAVFDVTNPEIEPQFLAEIPIPDGSFSTVYPAIVAFEKATDNSWYLMFGTGPDDMDSYTNDSNKTAHLYLFDLAQLRTKTSSPASSTTTPKNCTVKALNSYYNVLDCDTKQSGSFVGTPAVVDWNADFKADTAYFGLIGGGGSNPDTGMVMRFGFNNQTLISGWPGFPTSNANVPLPFYNPGKPVVGQPAPTIDNLGKHWIFFGTGRYFSSDDKATTDRHYLYGVKDGDENATTYPVDPAKLLDVSGVEAYSDANGTLAAGTGPTPIGGGVKFTTFAEIEMEIDEKALGWKMYLPPIIGDDTVPSTRSLNRPALLGGVLANSVFQPSSDICAGEGQSRLYGLYYKTGTANPFKTVFGTSAGLIGGVVKYRALKFLDLGRGVATTPALHSGKGSGSGSLKIFTQLSTGEIVELEGNTINMIRSGRTSWQER